MNEYKVKLYSGSVLVLETLLNTFDENVMNQYDDPLVELIHPVDADQNQVFLNSDEFESWRLAEERVTAWKGKEAETVLIRKKTSGETPEEIMAFVDPKHYKNYIADLQWIDAMSEIPSLRDPERFTAALELQVRKYLDRNGKDDRVQEIKKAAFYLLYLAMYLDQQDVSAEIVHEKLRW